MSRSAAMAAHRSRNRIQPFSDGDLARKVRLHWRILSSFVLILGYEIITIAYSSEYAIKMERGDCQARDSNELVDLAELMEWAEQRRHSIKA
jgi:hypothetical protein